MIKYILNIDGMMCNNCEKHLVEAIKNSFDVKSVEASYKKKNCVIISNELDEEKLKSVVAQTGYKLIETRKEPSAKKGIFSKIKK